MASSSRLHSFNCLHQLQKVLLDGNRFILICWGIWRSESKVLIKNFNLLAKVCRIIHQDLLQLNYKISKPNIKRLDELCKSSIVIMMINHFCSGTKIEEKHTPKHSSNEVAITHPTITVCPNNLVSVISVLKI